VVVDWMAFGFKLKNECSTKRVNPTPQHREDSKVASHASQFKFPAAAYKYATTPITAARSPPAGTTIPLAPPWLVPVGALPPAAVVGPAPLEPPAQRLW
jgi:hypothetical protein